MALSASEIKSLMKEKGWTFVDLAARWGVSVYWMSRLVNQTRTRPPMYDDAFRGLPPRERVDVEREPRHNRKRRAVAPAWTPEQMFPVGRLFEAIDNKIVEEGTRMAVRAVAKAERGVTIEFRLTEGDAAGEEFKVDMSLAHCHLADLGLDLTGQEVQR
jgi:hypothetical protein